MRRWAFSAIMALLTLGLDAPQLAQVARAVVIVHNRARLPDYLISDALDLVGRIYATAGIELACFPAPPASNSLPGDRLKIRIIVLPKEAAAAMAYPPDALGFTPGATGRPGWLAYILEHRVSAVARGYNTKPAIVLGAAMAHEIGHMFLSREHTPAGLMRAQFNQADFRRIARADSPFSDSEVAEIRARLGRAKIDLRASAGGVTR